MIDVYFSHALEDCTQTQAREKYLYLKTYASKALSSVLSVEVEDMVEMEYGLLESAIYLWKTLKQMYGSSNDKRSSSTNIMENMSSSSMHIDQDQGEQSSVQKEKIKSTSVGKPDDLIFQTGCSDFDRIEATFMEESDFSISSFDNDDDNDNTDDEDDDQVLIEEFNKLINMHMKLQKRHGDLLCSREKLIDSYAFLEATHEVMLTMVKFSQSHTCTCAPHSIDLSCTNSYCSQAKTSFNEHVLVETCDNLIASENDELKREIEILKMELSRLKGKCHVQPSKNKRDHMVKKLENG
jgi:hypothetical protein